MTFVLCIFTNMIAILKCFSVCYYFMTINVVNIWAKIILLLNILKQQAFYSTNLIHRKPHNCSGERKGRL